MLVLLDALLCRPSQGFGVAETEATAAACEEARKGVVAGRSIAWSFGYKPL